MLKIPPAPNSIQKGVPLKSILDRPFIEQIGANFQFVYPSFDKDGFVKDSMQDLESLGIKERGAHIAEAMRKYLPQIYSEAVQVILDALTPPLEKTEDNGLAPMFYMPHCAFVAKYGVDEKYNNGQDPFKLSMQLQYELTQRFTCEFSIRSFIEKDQERTMMYLYEWMMDENPHVR